MKISALIPNLATNCIVRAWPILKVLERRYEVEVIGSLMGQEELFPPYAREFSYKVVRWERPGKILANLKQLQAAISGDIVYAFKPLTASFGAALLGKFRGRLPIILDIEDWETWKLHQHGTGLKHVLRLARHLVGPGWLVPHSRKYRYLMERCSPLADATTVVSSFLRKRYGGVLLRHGANTAVFNPARYHKKTLREKWGIAPHLRLILFTGTPSPYKGIDDLLAALDLVSARDVRLLMAGKDSLAAPPAGKVLHLGYQPHSVMPELLAMADLVVLPQRRHPLAEAQIPAKVFEAMAMARPIVATAVSDLPEILTGCGMVVEPENVAQLAAAIESVLTDQQYAEDLAWKAREKCIREYSWEAMDRVLEEVIRPFSLASLRATPHSRTVSSATHPG
jgi:glycosyltransferase involved in cell wall biosynthesis